VEQRININFLVLYTLYSDEDENKMVHLSTITSFLSQMPMLTLSLTFPMYFKI
jgi:hypothetical protein